ncbi:hypothetical protein P3X46_034517 [Hevea brasiliensis]|uniref:DUF241 domain-containing protein n=1 Tax=Hevea brasiliensis TaxID=3981 RepID=A0ABQ9K9H4_HEVBR|nr:uncharacterized protein LOC110659042 [Hevea brasiliensis]KAJ9128756.1 hypothetical protein P3X46_034517 [Hevea brasiliensis]
MNSGHIPVRSISLPSWLHPNSLKIEAELTKLKSWDFSSSTSATNPLGAETIQMGLTKLAELLICVEELTQSPQKQEAYHHQRLDQVEKLIDASVGLVDVCGTARDLLLAMQEHIRDLQSALRRRGKDSSSIESDVQTYVSFRKRAKKQVTKSLATLKKMEGNALSFPTLDEEHHLSYVVKVIEEVHAIAVTIFRSVMLFLSPLATKTNVVGWSLISKLIRSGLHDSDRGEKIFNEVGKTDIALCSIHGKIRKNNDANFDVQQVQERLETLDVSIQYLEAKLDCLFRCLIQNRVSLLNLVTP